jgi:hypothetical protein
VPLFLSANGFEQGIRLKPIPKRTNRTVFFDDETRGGAKRDTQTECKDLVEDEGSENFEGVFVMNVYSGANMPRFKSKYAIASTFLAKLI